MESVNKEVLGLLPKAEEQGLITKEEKMQIKEFLMEDDNNIVKEYLEEYESTKDYKTLFVNFKSYLDAIRSDDENDENSKVKIADLQSPEDVTLMRSKLSHQKKNTSNKNQPKTISNLETCEDGLSPTVIFTKKK